MISKKKIVEPVALIINLDWDQKSPKRKLSIKKLKEPITIVNFKLLTISTSKLMNRFPKQKSIIKFTNKTSEVVDLYQKNEII